MATPETKTRAGGAERQAGKGGAKAAESIGFLAIAAVILVLANVVGYFFFTRIDLTPNRLFTLSDGSKRLVSDLEDELRITAYYTSGLPAPWPGHERQVRDLLSEYESAGNRVRLRWVDPDTEEEKTEAREAGVVEQILGGGDTRSATIVRGFVGIVIEYVGERQTINFPAPTTEGLEYEISSRIQQLVREPMPIGVVSGHGSPTLDQGLSSLRRALPSYELRSVDLDEEIDRELRALLIVDPTEAFTPRELQRINQFVMRGGSLGVFGGVINVSLQGGFAGPSATLANTQLNDLLQAWGIELGQGMVADANCARVPMRTQFGFPALVPFPPIPRIAFDEVAQEHPVAFRVPSAPFFFTAPIRTNDRFHELDGVVLGRSSAEASWLLTGDHIGLTPRDPREWASTMGSQQGPHTVMVALQGRLPSAFAGAAAMSSNDGGDEPPIEAPAQAEQPVRVLVAGTGTMLRDEFLPRNQEGAQQLTEGLILALNAIDWLAQDADLIAVRAKSVDEPPIEAPELIQQAEAQASADQA
ncbi:MAG TPA: GldG family protein, partial [Sandaracinaceae bacterium]